MKELINSLNGDKVIWAFVALLALFSFMPVFSASSNLAYMRHGTGNTFTYLLKHAAQVLVGFFILYKVRFSPTIATTLKGHYVFIIIIIYYLFIIVFT